MLQAVLQLSVGLALVYVATLTPHINAFSYFFNLFSQGKSLRINAKYAKNIVTLLDNHMAYLADGLNVNFLVAKHQNILVICKLPILCQQSRTHVYQ